jgi:non-heme chloroperoxidase
MTTFTASERHDIDAANASGKPVIVFIHGLWAIADAWKPWREHFEGLGYATVAATWPGEPTSFADGLAHPEKFAGMGIQDVADHHAALIRELDAKPFLLGHSFGGLLAQKLAGLGLATATVLLEPAPVKGVLPLPPALLKATLPVLGNPANFPKAIRLTYPQFRYAWTNAVENEDESRRLWETEHLAAPARPLFQAALARFQPHAEAEADTTNPERGPILIIGGTEDHLVPPPVYKAAFRIQSRNPNPTELVELPRGHSMPIDSGWREVADVAQAFLVKQGVTVTA